MKIICNTPGKGILMPEWYDTAKCGTVTQDERLSKYIQESTTITAFHSDNTTPLPIGEWDVELVWQYKDKLGRWIDVQKGQYLESDVETRHAYMLPPAQPVKAVEEEKPHIAAHWNFDRHKVCDNCNIAISDIKHIDNCFGHGFVSVNDLMPDNKQVVECICFDRKSDGYYSTAFNWNFEGYTDAPVLFWRVIQSLPHPVDTPAIATSEVVEEAAEIGYLKYSKASEIICEAAFHCYVDEDDDYCLKITLDSAIKAMQEYANHIKATHVPVDEVEKIKSVLKQIRRVELLTPETEALINKILNP